MWTVIYVSQSIETAKKLIDVLLTNKVISKLRRTNNCNGNESSCYEAVSYTHLHLATRTVTRQTIRAHIWR